MKRSERNAQRVARARETAERLQALGCKVFIHEGDKPSAVVFKCRTLTDGEGGGGVMELDDLEPLLNEMEGRYKTWTLWHWQRKRYADILHVHGVCLEPDRLDKLLHDLVHSPAAGATDEYLEAVFWLSEARYELAISNGLSVEEVAAAQEVSEQAAQRYIDDKKTLAAQRVRALEEKVAKLEHRLP